MCTQTSNQAKASPENQERIENQAKVAEVSLACLHFTTSHSTKEVRAVLLRSETTSKTLSLRLVPSPSLPRTLRQIMRTHSELRKWLQKEATQTSMQPLKYSKIMMLKLPIWIYQMKFWKQSSLKLNATTSWTKFSLEGHQLRLPSRANLSKWLTFQRPNSWVVAIRVACPRVKDNL